MCHGRWCYSNIGTKTLPIAEVRAFICATLLASKHFESVYGVLLGIRIFWKPRHYGACFWTEKANGDQFYIFDTPGFRSFLRWPSSTDHPTITPRSRQPPISPYPPSNIPPRVDPAALPPDLAADIWEAVVNHGLLLASPTIVMSYPCPLSSEFVTLQHTVYLYLLVCKLHINFISAKLTRAGAKNKNKIGEVPPKNAGLSTTTPNFQTQYLHALCKKMLHIHATPNICSNFPANELRQIEKKVENGDNL